MSISNIELRNIGKYYYSENSVTQALRKVSLSFQKNEFVAITGESGSGKSTLLKLISGMDTYDDGEMFLDGEATSQYDDDDWEQYRRQEIGYVFQDYSLIGHYNARDNIISALLIMGMELEEAREKALQYLERVGLREQEKQMASKLSSGQKQRLSIARALAKGTDIIVADEPTGNLDSETGEQIVRLLADLSKDHLVIMVTHNYEQVAPYVSRKIFLHDGEVASDTPVNQKPEEESDSEEGGNGKAPPKEKSPEEKNPEEGDAEGKNLKEAKQDIHRIAMLFAKWNIRTQAGKVILFTAFFLVTALVSFLFIGELLMNADDRLSKAYDSSAYANETKTRIVVRHKDNSPITEQDIKVLQKQNYVTRVDQYDCVDDINYYYRPNKDYIYFFGYSDEEYGGGTSVEFLDHSNFMHSSTCITKEDLAAGKMPEELGEIVMYSKDGEAALDQELKIYLQDENAWGSDQYVCRNFKVVGLLKDKTKQIYFSPKYCEMLTVGMSCPRYKLYFYYDLKQNKLVGRDSFIPMADESLDHDEIYGDLALQVSKHYKMPVDGYDILPKKKEEGAFGGEKDYLEIYHYDREGNLEEEVESISAQGISNENYHESSSVFLAMSEAAFEAYNDMNNYQASVYFSSYAKTEHVLKALEKEGFDAISTFQASVTEYDEEKVTARLTVIVIALVVLLVLFASEILILRSLMKIQIKDFSTMKFMGMKMGLMKRISYYEMGIYLIAALCITLVLMHIGRLRASLLHEMLYYYEWPGYLLFVGYNLLTGLVTVALFNRLLKGRMAD